MAAGRSVVARRRRKRTGPTAKVGDWVLIGRQGITMPTDWFAAHVLWADGDEILTEHEPPSGIPKRYRQVFHQTEVRAIGTLLEVHEIRRRAQREVRRLEKQVRDAEVALDRARGRVWDKLEALGASALRVT